MADHESTSEPPMDTARILEGLNNLEASLKAIKTQSSPPSIGHYRELPSDVSESYEIMQQGASLIHATSTKYTLTGKISQLEQEKLANDLIKGCQLVATGALVLGNDVYGCSRSARHYAKRAARAIVATTTQLVEAFDQPTGPILEKDNNLGAQKCGAVWDTCDVILKKRMPQGNRNAMRRDLFTWVMECNETMEEFHEMIERGPSLQEEEDEESKEKDDNKHSGDDIFDAFCAGNDDEQFTTFEIPVAQAGVALVKCSRGSLNATLKASDSAGEQIDSGKLADDQKKALLSWISSLHDLARNVGEGMTDFGALLYPTISLGDVERQAVKQAEEITAVTEFILDSSHPAIGGVDLDEEATEIATKLRTAANARLKELTDAVAAAQES